MNDSAVLAIVGLPGSGKTTLADALGAHLGLEVLHTDDFKVLPWQDQPGEVLGHLTGVGIVEGITVARMFRRGFAPDCVIWVLGGDDRGRPALRSLIDRGLREYDGRVVTVPTRPKLDTVLWALGTPEEHDA